MPSYISGNKEKKIPGGIWMPAHERAVDMKTGEVHDGPDRAATEYLKTEGVSFLGVDSTKDPENIMRARQLGMTVEEWLKMNEPPTPEAIANEEAKKTMVVDHKPGRKKQPVCNPGAGVDKMGGFGDLPK